MKSPAALPILLAAGCLLAASGLRAAPGPAAPLNLATVSCDKYENEIVGSPDRTESSPQAAAVSQRPDPIDTVMWLFGFSVAKAGDHFMYGDALASFGFALDAECRNHPATTLLQAVTIIRPKRDKPMDLSVLQCGAFESRHADSEQSDPQSAKTIMMWLFGFSAGLSGNHVLDASGLERFAASLKTRCTQNQNLSLFDMLSALSRTPPH